jgi:hypothetical protein
VIRVHTSSASPPGIPSEISAVARLLQRSREGGALSGGPAETVLLPARALLDRLLTAREVAEILLARQYPARDIAAEVAAWLTEHPPATVPEIAFGISARESTVRHAVTTDDRFRRAASAPERSPRARCWQLAVPANSTQPSARRSGSRP